MRKVKDNTVSIPTSGCVAPQPVTTLQPTLRERIDQMEKKINETHSMMSRVFQMFESSVLSETPVPQATPKFYDEQEFRRCMRAAVKGDWSQLKNYMARGGSPGPV